MFCSYCGQSQPDNHAFCTKCGKQILKHESPRSIEFDSIKNLGLRISKVIYILLYLPLPLILWAVWTSTYYTYSYISIYDDVGTKVESPEKALLYTACTLLIYLILVRLIKLAFLYIFFGYKINWRNEVKKIY